MLATTLGCPNLEFPKGYTVRRSWLILWVSKESCGHVDRLLARWESRSHMDGHFSEKINMNNCMYRLRFFFKANLEIFKYLGTHNWKKKHLACFTGPLMGKESGIIKIFDSHFLPACRTCAHLGTLNLYFLYKSQWISKLICVTWEKTLLKPRKLFTNTGWINLKTFVDFFLSQAEIQIFWVHDLYSSRTCRVLVQLLKSIKVNHQKKFQVSETV